MLLPQSQISGFAQTTAFRKRRNLIALYIWLRIRAMLKLKHLAIAGILEEPGIGFRPEQGNAAVTSKDAGNHASAPVMTGRTKVYAKSIVGEKKMFRLSMTKFGHFFPLPSSFFLFFLFLAKRMGGAP